jgi:glutaredoxin
MKVKKRLVEIFTAGCPVCSDTVKLVREMACESCEIRVYDLNAGCETNQCRQKTEQYGIRRLPAVVVDGKLVGCCENQNPVSPAALAAAGIGRCCK